MVSPVDVANTAVFLVCACLARCGAIKLPDYIKPCKADKTLDACALKTGQAAIHNFINGDAKYRVPSLEPFEIPRLSIRQGGGGQAVGLNITIVGCRLRGLSGANFVKSRMDLANRHIQWDFTVPRMSLDGDYKADGKVLILPITGDGLGNITLVNVSLSYKFDFRLEKRKGEDYVKVYNARMTFDAGRMYVRMANLFNGDKLLSETMHRFLDENWREVLKELGPGVGDAIAAAFTLIFTNIVGLVPYKQIFVF